MKYIFYHTRTAQAALPRPAPYTVDGQPGKLPPETVELQIIDREPPKYEPETERLERSEAADLDARQWVRGWRVVALDKDALAVMAARKARQAKETETRATLTAYAEKSAPTTTDQRSALKLLITERLRSERLVP